MYFESLVFKSFFFESFWTPVIMKRFSLSAMHKFSIFQGSFDECVSLFVLIIFLVNKL